LNHQNPLLPSLLSIDLEQEARLDDHEELETTIKSEGGSTERQPGQDPNDRVV